MIQNTKTGKAMNQDRGIITCIRFRSKPVPGIVDNLPECWTRWQVTMPSQAWHGNLNYFNTYAINWQMPATSKNQTREKRLEYRSTQSLINFRGLSLKLSICFNANNDKFKWIKNNLIMKGALFG